MSQPMRKWLFRTGTVILAGMLLYLGLRGIDLQSLQTDLQHGHYLWAVPLFAITLFSHLLRAVRWRILIHALPERTGSHAPVPLKRAFASLMIGYMVNYVVPRFGEVVRTSHLSLREKLTFGGVFGTVVAERLIDMITLSLCLLTIPFFLGSRTKDLLSIVGRPIGNMVESNQTEFIVVALLAILLVATGAYLLFRKSNVHNSRSRFAASIVAFRQGLMTLARSGRAPSIAVVTVSMWMCYGLMAYTPLLIFDMTTGSGLSMADAWVLMLIGSVALVVPSPGGIGSYHFLTIQALVLLWGITQETAASYAIFTHLGQMLLYLVTGFSIILLEGASWSQLKSASIQDATDAGIIEGSN